MQWLYLGFVALIGVLLALDLGVFHRKLHVVRVREALAWSGLWIGLGLAFAAVIYVGYEAHWLGLGTTADAMSTPTVDADGVAIYNDGGSAMVKYLTGFVVEKSLAVDNIFVIAMIFAAFAVPPVYQHRVLFWGVVGALVMRGAMIAIGATLLARFAWVMYVFGGFLILTGVKMLLLRGGEGGDLQKNPLVRLARRLLPVTERYHGARFFVRAGTPASHAPAVEGAAVEPDRVVDRARKGALLVTPLLLALLVIEATDVIFAVDSIPAIFAITTDPFLVFTSNIFAILGLRTLYFALAGMIEAFRYLKVALATVLVLVGTKMVLHGSLVAWLGAHVNLYALAAIATILATGVIASLVAGRRPKAAAAAA